MGACGEGKCFVIRWPLLRSPSTQYRPTFNGNKPWLPENMGKGKFLKMKGGAMVFKNLIYLFSVALSSYNVLGQTYSDITPTNRSASASLSTRNLALGELQFANPDLYNLYDQGGSPMGFLETNSHGISLDFNMLNSSMSAASDSLEYSHGDFFLPTLRFCQPGSFAAVFYFQRESEKYRLYGRDTMDLGKSHFGLDLTAGASSGLLRVGFGVHGILGSLEYPGSPKRVLLGAPSIRLDIGSRFYPGLEMGIFTGVSGQFDSLENQANQLERVATATIPIYGALLDIGEINGIPLHGNIVFEKSTLRTFGEYRVGILPGVVYPTLWTDKGDFKTQWMYTHKLNEFILAPALRFGHHSEDAQGYLGIKGTSDPFKSGAKIDTMAWTLSSTSFGLGGRISYLEYLSFLCEWETSGHALRKRSKTTEERYHRFSLGLENRVGKMPYFTFPKGSDLAIRLGWTWRDEPQNRIGYRDYQFDTFIPMSNVPSRLSYTNPTLSPGEGYGAFHLGLGLSLLNEKLVVDGQLSFPGQAELIRSPNIREASGTEFGLTASVRLF